MHIEKLKLFLHGLPPDCQGSTLKDFLEGIYDVPGVITKVSIPSKKTYAFVSVSHTEVVDFLLRTTLLYCDDNGQFYQIKARHYKRPHYKKEHQRDKLPDKESQGHSTDGANSQPAKYTTPQHVHQLTPDYSMLSFSKPKRRRRKQDDSLVWFCGIGSTSSKRKHKGKKKKKKQSSRQELLKSESFQFGSLYPESKSSKENMGLTEDIAVKQMEDSTAQVTSLKSIKQDEHVPAMVLNPSKCLGPKSSKSQVIVDHSYLGPMCLQLTNPSSVADVKREIMERTGLPVRNQHLYCNGKKLRDDLNLESLLDDDNDSVTLRLFEGFLKGGVRPMEKQDQAVGAVGGERDQSVLRTEVRQMEKQDQAESAVGGEGDRSVLGTEVRPMEKQDQAESAVGGEGDQSVLGTEEGQSMENWNPQKTAAWLCSIGPYEKYADICRKQGKEIKHGRSLYKEASRIEKGL